MSDVIIKIENLSKQYRLGNLGKRTLKKDLQRWWAKKTGKEDPTIPIGLENKLSEKGGEFIYALKDINLEIKKGELLGIIGKNGAGKSTLLKILSNVTTPTTGFIDLYGRAASLLEVGTGFHPELTGRENIFLNGAIMGMTKSEIRSRFDEIVDFSGAGKYIDTPVKRYSSGMYVRLGFAIAAHLEPEILIVDEVLAVGDAEFQRKAIGKMQDVSRNEGRTVLFVSHNMAAVRSLCKSAVMLHNGSVLQRGSVSEVVATYNEITNLRRDKNIPAENNIDSILSICERFELKHPYLTAGFATKAEFNFDEEIKVNFDFNFTEHVDRINPEIALYDKKNPEYPVFTSHMMDDQSAWEVLTEKNLLGPVRIKTKLDIRLNKGDYYVVWGIRNEFEQDAVYNGNRVLEFKIADAPLRSGLRGTLVKTTAWEIS